MVPPTLRSGAKRCQTVASHARDVATHIAGLPEPEGMPADAKHQLRQAIAQLERSSATIDRQAGWLINRAALGMFADGPFDSPIQRLTEPPLLTPWAMPSTPKPYKPLKIPDPNEDPIDRLFGRDYILPEEISEYLENGPGREILQLPKYLGLQAGKAARAFPKRVPGGGLKAHEGPGRGHTLQRHTGQMLSDMRARLNATKLRSVSSFADKQLADDAVSAAITSNKFAIEQGLAKKGVVELRQEFDRPVGRLLRRDGTIVASRKIVVVLVKDNSELGYYVKTAYPVR